MVRLSLLLLVLGALCHLGSSSSVYQCIINSATGQDVPDCRIPQNATFTPSVACRSIKYAIELATPSDFIILQLQPGTYSGTQNTGLIMSYARLTITGTAGADGAYPTIDCLRAGTGFVITPAQPQDYSITRITFKNCQAATGGAINVQNGQSQFVVTSCIFTDNTATQDGGAIYASNPQGISIQNSVFTNNTAKQGGAISAANQPFTVRRSFFQYNTAETGGAIYGNNLGSSTQALLFINNTFSSNVVSGQAGAVYLKSDGVRNYDFFQTVFDNNCATSPYTDSYKVQVTCISTTATCNISIPGTSSGCTDTYTPPVPKPDKDKALSDKNKTIIIGVVVPFAILALVAIAVFFYVRKNHNKEMGKRDEYRKKILRALENLPPEEQEAARLEAERADPNAPKCQLCQARPINSPLPCGHEIVCSVCRTILLECPVKGCKKPTR